MFLIRILLVLMTVNLFNFSQKPAIDTRVILEDTRGKQVGSQTVGKKGKAAFQYLNEGNYRLKIIFPQQEGKWIKEKRRYTTLIKASYNPRNKTYYYQGEEGYFAVKFSHIKRVENDQFKAIFSEDRRGSRTGIVIAEFQSRRSGAGIQITINAITAARFKKKTRKGEYNITLLSIPSIK